MIISYSGKLGSGKDLAGAITLYLIWKKQVEDGVVGLDNRTISDFERSRFYQSWSIKKFADPLKDIACIILGCNRLNLEDREYKESELPERWWYYKAKLLDDRKYPYLEYKERLDNSLNYYIFKPTVREFLQLIGTECFRDVIHPNTWANIFEAKYLNSEHFSEKSPDWVVTDVRFPNELATIKKLKGITIKIERPSLKSTDTHASEMGLDSSTFDFTVVNDGSIEDFTEKIKQILIKIKVL